MKAFLFPGQGVQKEHMGKDLYDSFPKAKAIFEQANDILGVRFTDTLFTETEEFLMDTRYTQMGIFLYQCALVMGQDSVKPDCVAGHSLGEYAALVTAGVLSFEEAVPFIKRRGEAIDTHFLRLIEDSLMPLPGGVCLLIQLIQRHAIPHRAGFHLEIFCIAVQRNRICRIRLDLYRIRSGSFCGMH